MDTFHRFFAAMEVKLAHEDLTLRELREMEDTLVLRPFEPSAEELSQKIFCWICDKRDAILQKTLKNLEKEAGVAPKVQALFLSREYLSPDEIVREIHLLWQLATQEGNEEAKEVLQEMAFALDYPIVQELDSQGHVSTFASRLEKLGKEVVEGNTVEPFVVSFSEAQQRAVREEAGGGPLSPELVAEGIGRYVESLQRQAKIAKAFHFDDWEKMEEKWKAFNDMAGDLEGQRFLAAAILDSVEERMGFFA